jgi:hypothetical protein
LREEKKISRKEGESPRKKEIPLRLCYSAPLREQKSAAADPKCCGTGSKKTPPLREEKKISRKEGESPRKKEIPLRLSYFASLREQKKNVSLSAAADWTRRLCAFARKK